MISVLSRKSINESITFSTQSFPSKSYKSISKWLSKLYESSPGKKKQILNRKKTHLDVVVYRQWMFQISNSNIAKDRIHPNVVIHVPCGFYFIVWQLNKRFFSKNINVIKQHSQETIPLFELFFSFDKNPTIRIIRRNPRVYSRIFSLWWMR